MRFFDNPGPIFDLNAERYLINVGFASKTVLAF